MTQKYGDKEKLDKIIEQKKLNSTPHDTRNFPSKGTETSNSDEITFSTHRSKPYGCFSPLSPHSFTLSGKTWPTAVSYYVFFLAISQLITY